MATPIPYYNRPSRKHRRPLGTFDYDSSWILIRVKRIQQKRGPWPALLKVYLTELKTEAWLDGDDIMREKGWSVFRLAADIDRRHGREAWRLLTTSKTEETRERSSSKRAGKSKKPTGT